MVKIKFTWHFIRGRISEINVEKGYAATHMATCLDARCLLKPSHLDNVEKVVHCLYTRKSTCRLM